MVGVLKSEFLFTILQKHQSNFENDKNGFTRLTYAVNNVVSSSQKVHENISVGNQTKQTKIFANNLRYIQSIDPSCAQSIVSKVDEFYKQPQPRYPLRCVLQEYKQTATKNQAKPVSNFQIG